MKRTAIFSALLLLAAGCTPKASPPVFPTELPSQPVLVIPTQLPTATEPPLPTAVPPTQAAAPTAAPAPTATSSGGGLQVAPAERISFNAGATNTDVGGSIPQGGTLWFTIGALKGQTMFLSLDSQTQKPYLTVTNVNGNPMTGAGKQLTSFTDTLPATGDYLVEIINPGGSTNYDLQVTIPQRIVFDPGAISASVSGSVGKGRINNYLARASAGQTMTVTVTSAGSGAGLTIYGIQDGNPLVRAVSGATTWTGKLTLTQDYMIDVVSQGDAVDYSLKITIK